MWYEALVSEAVTQGLRVKVQSTYVPEQSNPRQQRYVFAYTIRITNEASSPPAAESSLVITHGTGQVEEVRGPGVGARSPVSSRSTRRVHERVRASTPHGTMHGTYEMKRDDSSTFQAKIAPFSLSMPYALN